MFKSLHLVLYESFYSLDLCKKISAISQQRCIEENQNKPYYLQAPCTEINCKTFRDNLCKAKILKKIKKLFPFVIQQRITDCLISNSNLYFTVKHPSAKMEIVYKKQQIYRKIEKLKEIVRKNISESEDNFLDVCGQDNIEKILNIKNIVVNVEN